MGSIFDINSARLLLAGSVHANPNWSYPSHAHTHWEFIYFLRGCGRIDLPHTTLHPQQYYLAVYPPGLPHAEYSDPDDPEETRFFGVDVAGTPPLGAHLLLPDQRGELRWLCERIVSEHEAHGVSPLAETYARAFLLLVERAWESGIPVQHDAVDAAVQYLHANYPQPITLRMLAELVHLSETHFAHRFSARLGISPIRYLQHLRIDAARRLLATTDLRVNDIAAQVGYSDPLYFSRTFKQMTGASPKAYRLQAHTAR